MVTLLMTRAKDASDRFVDALPPDLHPRIVRSPLIGIVPVASGLDISGAKGIIFTSGNGVETASALTSRRDLPCFCVGQATTAKACATGWLAECAGRNADELVSALIARPPQAPLVHLRGVHARGGIADRLTAAGIETHAQAIYDQPLLPLSGAAIAALAGSDPVVVPLFSPRAARHFASLAEVSAPLFLAAMSGAVADPLKTLPFRWLQVAERPDIGAMADAVAAAAWQAIRVVGGSDPQ